MAEPFKLPGSSYDELTKIIAAYSNFPGEASPSDVGKLLGVDQTTISRNNGFLAAIGLIEDLKGGKKTSTDLGRDLGRALDHNLSDRVQEAWRAVVSKTDFLRNLVSAVRIRNGMDPNSFISHVGYSAGLPKAARTATGGRTILAILVAAGAVQSADGKIVAVSRPDPSSIDRPDTSSAGRAPARQPTVVASAPSAHVQGDVAVTIRVNINVSADELQGLGRRLRVELEQLSTDYEVEVEDADVAEPG